MLGWSTQKMVVLRIMSFQHGLFVWKYGLRVSFWRTDTLMRLVLCLIFLADAKVPVFCGSELTYQSWPSYLSKTMMRLVQWFHVIDENTEIEFGNRGFLLPDILLPESLGVVIKTRKRKYRLYRRFRLTNQPVRPMRQTSLAEIGREGVPGLLQKISATWQ